MRPVGTSALRCGQATLICSALLVFLGILDANAGTTRTQKSSEFSVPLQPFTLDPSEVHHAAPVAAKEPRIVRATAVTPLKVAYVTRRAVRVTPSRGESVEDQTEESAHPIRVAYQVPPAARPAEPQPELTGDDDGEQDLGPEQDDEPTLNESRGDRPTVPGNRALLRNGIAYAPERAPQSVKEAIWAVNSLRLKPYVWGGGHRSFYDRGYDCSGSVSFALHQAGLLSAPLPSDDFVRYGRWGRGRWITVYSRPGHTFAIIAGLRLDTTDLGTGEAVGPRWYVTGRNTRNFVARHPSGF